MFFYYRGTKDKFGSICKHVLYHNERLVFFFKNIIYLSEQEWEGGIGGAEEEAEADSLPDQQKLDAGLYPDPRASEIMT